MIYSTEYSLNAYNIYDCIYPPPRLNRDSCPYSEIIIYAQFVILRILRHKMEIGLIAKKTLLVGLFMFI